MTAKLNRLHERADSYLAGGNLEATKAVCESILAKSRDDSRAHLLLSHCAANQDKQRLACAHALAAVSEARGSSSEHRLHLTMRLFSVGEYEAAAELIRATDIAGCRETSLLVNFSQQLRLLDLHSESLAFLEAAIATGAVSDSLSFLKGNALKFLGQLELAAIEYEKCLAMSPNHSGAHWALANLGQSEDSPARITRIRRVLDRGAPSAVDEIYLSYALFKELDGLDDTNAAWSALQNGHRLKRKTIAHDRLEESTIFNQVMAATDDEFMRPLDGATGTRTPIFILGMPRTGTTLLERILGGHEQITLCGELNDFRMQFKWASDHNSRGFLDARGIQCIPTVDFGELGRRYLQQIAWRAPNTRYFSDKNPGNFIMAGLILRALPHARIVHLRRGPMDTCFSNLKELFGANSYPYSYDFADLAVHYRNYSKLMTHWHNIAPGRILDVDYEDMVSDPDATARRVMGYCGLSYDAAQIRVEANATPVSTASSAQVRQPIHRRNIGGWKRYAAQLAPLQKLLEDAAP